MRRLTQIEAGILIIAALFIFAGANMVIHPTDGVIVHQGRGARLFIQHFTKPEEQLCGALAILLGAGLAGLVFYQRGR
jgi:hypothetical protein